MFVTYRSARVFRHSPPECGGGLKEPIRAITRTHPASALRPNLLRGTNQTHIQPNDSTGSEVLELRL